MSAARNDRLAEVLAARLETGVRALRPIAGGDINDAYAAETDGGRVFVKTRDGAAGSFAQEAAGLRWLGEVAGGPPVARVIDVHDPDGQAGAPPAPRYLALRWIEPGAATAAAEERFGRELATLHAAACPAFGWAPSVGPLAIAGIELPAAPVDRFAGFWAEQRILPLAHRAHAVGAFSAADVALMERLAARVDALVGPREPPSRTHGDLWAGNVLADVAGRMHLIDPLAHGSHREVDLAALRVFGGPGERCFAAYREAYPLADGAEDRIPLMQVGIILLHAVLFGGAYAAQARAIAQRYC